jgi:hypothetical protein
MNVTLPANLFPERNTVIGATIPFFSPAAQLSQRQVNGNRHAPLKVAPKLPKERTARCLTGRRS